MRIALLALVVLFAGAAATQLPVDRQDEPSVFEISTDYGTMRIRLSDETPGHRDNFRRLVAEGFYDGTLFHRIINGFMIQGGDPLSRDADDPLKVGGGGPGYELDAEFNRNLIHRRGAVASARQGDAQNPERKSSGSQFYIVHGRTFDDAELDEVERRIRSATNDTSFAYTAEERDIYRTEGGAPFLDMQYVVFGQLIDGFDVLDSLAAVPTPNSLERPAPPPLMDRPLTPVPMSIRAVE